LSYPVQILGYKRIRDVANVQQLNWQVDHVYSSQSVNWQRFSRRRYWSYSIFDTVHSMMGEKADGW